MIRKCDFQGKSELLLYSFQDGFCDLLMYLVYRQSELFSSKEYEKPSRVYDLGSWVISLLSSSIFSFYLLLFFFFFFSFCFSFQKV